MEIVEQICEEDVLAYKETMEHVYFPTRFSFMGVHNGLRPGKLHTITGNSSGGKSTLVRSIIRDLFTSGMQYGKVYTWLSEETCNDFRMEMARSCSNFNTNHLTIESEQDIKSHQSNELYFYETIKQQKPDVFILDNITTSHFYADKPIPEQLAFIKRLKQFAAENKIPFIVIAHTGAEVTENISRLISMNDIRGSKAIVNLAEFFYILQRFKINGEYFPTIRVLKHRGFTVKEVIHFLKFDKESVCYMRSFPLKWEEFKKAYDSREKL